MKTITILLFTIILNSCGATKEATSLADANSTTTLENSKITQENVKIEYSSQSRGFFNKIISENKTVSLQNRHDSKPLVSSCSDKDWDKLMAMASELNLKDLSTLEAPSKAHQYDGAPIANFSITKDGNTYEVPTFDAGNPHKDIATLVEMVINIANKSKEKN